MSRTASASTNNTDNRKSSPNLFSGKHAIRNNCKYGDENMSSSVSEFYNKSNSSGSGNNNGCTGIEGYDAKGLNWFAHSMASYCNCNVSLLIDSELRKIEKECYDYCWCDLPLIILRGYYKAAATQKTVDTFLQPEPQPLNQLVQQSQTNKQAVIHKDESDIYQNSEDSNRLTKSDLNLELLKDFEYETEVRGSEIDDKPLIVYICKFQGCNKEFTRTWNILDHARMHMGVKPFQCNLCPKSFTQKGNLKKHMKTHMLPDVEARKRYKCEFCDSSYTERYNYKIHLKKNHSHQVRRRRQQNMVAQYTYE